MAASDSTEYEYGTGVDFTDVPIPEDLRPRDAIPCAQCEVVRLVHLYANTVARNERSLIHVTSAFLDGFNSLHPLYHRHLAITLRRVDAPAAAEPTVSVMSSQSTSVSSTPPLKRKRLHHSASQPRGPAGR